MEKKLNDKSETKNDKIIATSDECGDSLWDEVLNQDTSEKKDVDKHPSEKQTQKDKKTNN